MKLNYIVIEGNIGAGKTTLSKMLANEFNGKLILEQFAQNPFLARFYQKPAKYSFQLEISFLADRYQQLNKAFSVNKKEDSLIISDYYFNKSLIFSKETLTQEEFDIYKRIFNIIYKETIPKPDLYVYLHLNVQNLMKNIQDRGRIYEKEITSEYLTKIQQGYLNFFKQQNDIPILKIDINQVDFVENQIDYLKIKENIFKKRYKNGLTSICI